MTPAQADVLRQLRFRERLHLAAIFAEQEHADARVLAEHTAAKQRADEMADRHNPYTPENTAGLHGSAFSVRADGTKIPY